MNHVQQERDNYKKEFKKYKEATDSDTLYLAIDFKTGLAFPKFGQEPQGILGLKRRICHIFGIVEVDNSNQQCHLYFYDDKIGAQNWRHVTSILEKFLAAKGSSMRKTI